MPRAKLCLAARAVIRDAGETGISVFSILDRVAAQGFPVLIQQAGVLAVWEREQGDPNTIENVELLIRNNQQEIARANISIDFRTSPTHRSVVNMAALFIQQPGSVEFRFTLDNVELSRYEIIVDGPMTTAPTVTGA
jgi:hypothetical protein